MCTHIHTQKHIQIHTHTHSNTDTRKKTHIHPHKTNKLKKHHYYGFSSWVKKKNINDGGGEGWEGWGRGEKWVL